MRMNLKIAAYGMIAANMMLLGLNQVVHAAPANLDSGKAIYMKYCFYCHGKEGKGDGAIAIAVKPKPVNFVNDVERMRRTDAELMRSIEDGIIRDPDSRMYMPAWKDVLSSAERWDVLAYVRAFAAQGGKQLAVNAKVEAAIKGESKESMPAPDDMVYIPAGAFIMGSDKVDTDAMGLRFGSTPYYLNERPKRTVTLKAYYIDKYEVTNQQYSEFVEAMQGRVRIPAPAYWENVASMQRIRRVFQCTLCIGMQHRHTVAGEGNDCQQRLNGRRRPEALMAEISLGEMSTALIKPIISPILVMW